MEAKKAVKFITVALVAVLTLVVACPSFSITSKAAPIDDVVLEYPTYTMNLNRLYSGEPKTFHTFYSGHSTIPANKSQFILFNLTPNLDIDQPYVFFTFHNVRVSLSSGEIIMCHAGASDSLSSSVTYGFMLPNEKNDSTTVNFVIEADVTFYYDTPSLQHFSQTFPIYRIDGKDIKTSGTFKFTTPQQVVTYALKNQLMWIKSYLAPSTGRVDTWKIELPDIKATTPSYETNGSVNFNTNIPTTYLRPDDPLQTNVERNYISINPRITCNIFRVTYTSVQNIGYTESDIYKSISIGNNTLNSILSAVQGMDTSTLVEQTKEQTEELKKQTEEQKKQTEALTKYENADKMDSESGSLSGAIDDYNKVSDSLFESAGNSIADFDLGSAFQFSSQLISAFGFLSTIITNIVQQMGYFSILYPLGVGLVIIGALLGLFKYVSNAGGPGEVQSTELTETGKSGGYHVYFYYDNGPKQLSSGRSRGLPNHRGGLPRKGK